jgi:predicted O-methyltransferase YrrM
MIYNPHAPDWHKEAPPDITLAEYAAAWIDMAPHIGELAVYARDKKVIVEFGLRGAVSTWAMLDAMPEDGRLIGIDIDPNVRLPKRVRDDPRFHLIIGDATHADRDEPDYDEIPSHADLVMIDAGHEFAETVIELVQAARLTPDVILCHDYLYQHTPGVRAAIDGYTAKGYLRDEPYRLETVHPSTWGLAVLVKR